MTEDHVHALLALGYESLKNADLGNASRFFDEALHEDFDSAEVLFSMKCAQFWRERIDETSLISSPLLKGDQIVSRWKTFQAFLSRISGDFEMAKYAFKRMAFSVALDFFLAIPDEEKASLGAEFDFRRRTMPQGARRLRNFPAAFGAGGQNIKKDEARFLAELADCHALSGEQRLSKVFFREAFFIAPDKIDLELLESDMIQKLIAKAREEDYTGEGNR